MSQNQFNPNILQDLLPVYYKRLFPHISFYRWISYGLSEPNIFTNREISFTLNNDIYMRYLSFETQSELEKAICTQGPYKIDIGAVMNLRPKDHRQSTTMRPVQRELVFDIDMTDYDDVRTCCSGADVCTKCWKFMTIACRTLDTALRDDFGFEHILWVFSGRRGIHCWVCDMAARHLDGKGRSAVAEYLQIIDSGGEGTVSTVKIGEKMHHSVRRAYRICEPMFEEIILQDQNLFATKKGLSYLLQSVHDENLRKELESQLKQSIATNDSKLIWSAFSKFILSMRGQGPQARYFRNTLEEIQLALLYPRLDINVTKGLNHLLKAPFCVHPKTGKVCLPFNPTVASKFDPTIVPTINHLLDEINSFDEKSQVDNENNTQATAAGGGGVGDIKQQRIKDYKKTGMFKGVVVFDEFLRKLENSYKENAKLLNYPDLEF